MLTLSKEKKSFPGSKDIAIKEEGMFRNSATTGTEAVHAALDVPRGD